MGFSSVKAAELSTWTRKKKGQVDILKYMAWPAIVDEINIFHLQSLLLNFGKTSYLAPLIISEYNQFTEKKEKSRIKKNEKSGSSSPS